MDGSARPAIVRLFVSVDIEGIAGLVAREQGRVGGHEYEQARTWMTDSVLAVCESAHDRGVTEVVVADSHGNGQNVQFERMPDYVQLVRSWPRPLGMMQGIEAGTYVGAILLGYHAGSTNPCGVLSHTLSSDFFHEIRLNGQVTSEAGLSAALAAHYRVPVLMVAGDDVFVAEARSELGEMPSAVLKTAYGTSSALIPSLAVSKARLRAATREALESAGQRTLNALSGTVEVSIRLRTRAVAEWLAFMPEIERTDAFSIRYRAADIVAASRFLMFATFAKASVS